MIQGRKTLKLELLLLFDRHRGFRVKDIFERLPHGYCSLKTLYNYHAKWKKSDRKARELERNFL